MSEISKAYEPKSVEDRWYEYWMKHGCFTADPARVSERRPAYSIVIPPPNITGILTLGHVLNNTIQDILTRKARMDGREVLWLPGTDHAGIGTQTVIERTLKKQGVIRHRDDLGREKFIEKAWEWKEKHGGIIIQQLKKIGASCDWTRERFTMDPEYSRCVERVFVELYRKGLIYRGYRMVNWCPASRTALSDEEVEMKEQKGLLYHFKIEVAERPGTWLTIATTRPETIPGDTAIAVNPSDPRYQALIGLHALRPLPIHEGEDNPRRIPIIADEHIDPKFGTGVLKVTPAHDPADFEIGQRHGLRTVCVMNDDGTLNRFAGSELEGLDRSVGRKKAVELLKDLGILVAEEPYVHNVGFSDRANVPVEPWLSLQWFLRYPSVDKAHSCVALAGDRDTTEGADSRASNGDLTAVMDHGRPGTMHFHPARWSKVYDHWMANIKDWCISRQLWWGHRIPVWRRTYSQSNGGVGDSSNRQTGGLPHRMGNNPLPVPEVLRTALVDPRKPVSLSGTVGEWSSCESQPTTNAKDDSIEVSVATLGPSEIAWLEARGFIRDTDVLDTWFSSWLWPFATMGWTGDPARDAQNSTLKAFYPTTDLVTGPDIIFFWVARMIMAGFEFMGDKPFHNVYFTGIIRDKQGQKMSKSLGNSPDPLDLIAKYGADALRFGVMRSAPLGQDVVYDELNVELGRNFCNKLWNACRFRQMQGGEVQAEIEPNLLTNDDRWILLRLNQAILEIDAAYAVYKFNEVTRTLYRFFWNEYCDWYVEASKAAIASGDPALLANKRAVIDFVLSHALRLFHPFIPFISEELWHALGYATDMPAHQGRLTIMTAPWPKPLEDEELEEWGLDDSVERLAEAKFELVTLGRNLRAQYDIPANKKVPFIFRPSGELPSTESEVIRMLLNAESLKAPTADWLPEQGTPVVSNALGELFLPLAGQVDFAALRTKLAKEIERTRAEIAKVQEKLSNPDFTQKVPSKVLDEHHQRLLDWQSKERKLQGSLANLP